MREIENNKKEIVNLLKNPPKSWEKLFKEEGINATITGILSLLESTAGGNESLETETSSSNPKDYVPPDKVREEAMKGIRLSHKFNYPSYKGIGLARAVQLATQPTIWKRSVDRMDAFFKRNARYQTLSGFGDDNSPSKSYLAWLNWGGTSGMKWSKSM